jgi:SHS2 domain-containing protein
MEVRRLRISRLEIPELGDTRMTAVVKGEYGSGPPAREIKGVTYHGLEIRRAGGGCEAVIIVDV